MQIKSEKPDVVLLNGEFIANGFTVTENSTADQPKNQLEWDEIKDLFSTVMREIRATLPGVDIIPSIGNNYVFDRFRTPCK